MSSNRAPLLYLNLTTIEPSHRKVTRYLNKRHAFTPTAGLLLSKDLSRDLIVEEKTTSSLPHLLMKEQQERVFERQMQNAKKAEDAA